MNGESSVGIDGKVLTGNAGNSSNTDVASCIGYENFPAFAFFMTWVGMVLAITGHGVGILALMIFGIIVLFLEIWVRKQQATPININRGKRCPSFMIIPTHVTLLLDQGFPTFFAARTPSSAQLNVKPVQTMFNLVPPRGTSTPS
ncbi:uncharacterized protein LOC143466850 isoform X1 [Clavelina lepadiformis]|uniref:uncharacterized protein LOC143466850 isoform X1 n=1 Tax=Clavelina lepadiformis TaxID=159417 RepID=UPI0040431F39